MREVDTNAQIDMIQTMEQEEPVLVVTHIHQWTQADEMEWPPGELIIKANETAVHTLAELQSILDENAGGAVLLECRNGRIGYFRTQRDAGEMPTGAAPG